MKTVVLIVTPPEEFPDNFHEDQFGYTYRPADTGCVHRITKDPDGHLRTYDLAVLQGLVFQNEIDFDFPELDLALPNVKLEHYSGWSALFLSYMLIVGELVDVPSTKEIIEDTYFTLVDAISLGLLLSDDGEWFDLPSYDGAQIALNHNNEYIPTRLRIRTVTTPAKEVAIDL